MVVLYTSLLLLLTGASVLIRRRASALEKKYTAVLKEANTLLYNSPREGNSNRSDPYQTAKKNYQLGVLAQKKDCLEARHYVWQERADRLRGWLKAVRAWKGRKFPYVVGALDTVAALCVLEYLGLGEYTNPRHLVELFTSWLSS